MTCFWDAIIKRLTKNELQLLGITHKPNPKLLCRVLIDKNQLIDENILWQEKPLTLQERKEHFESIKNEPCYVHSGRLTSSCDSILLLLCHICQINIRHKGVYGESHYQYPNAKRNIVLYSNRGHMW